MNYGRKAFKGIFWADLLRADESKSTKFGRAPDNLISAGVPRKKPEEHRIMKAIPNEQTLWQFINLDVLQKTKVKTNYPLAIADNSAGSVILSATTAAKKSKPQSNLAIEIYFQMPSPK